MSKSQFIPAITVGGIWLTDDDTTEEVLGPDPKPIEVGTRFEILDHAPTGSYYLLKKKSTGNSRWVLEDRIREHGVATAFYDADPTWLPPTVRRK